ncbi:MAG: ParB/RepB/Spo0J family partition protein [bacterium]|nr:ParB/RepB/Spo0J family partition protein [bacterium]
MVGKKLVLANNPLFGGPDLSDRERAGSPYRELRIEVIDRDPNQPRVIFDEDKLAELASSIKLYGVLTPILVTPSKVPGRYKLISGERRLRASTLAGLTNIPAIVDREVDSQGDRTLAVQLVENLQRDDLTSLERAHAIGALKESFALSIREIADKLGVSKAMVQRSLEILELPDDLLNALREGASESKVLLLAKIEDPEMRASYLKDIDSLTRQDLKKSIDESGSEISKVEIRLSPEDMRITEEIQRSLGLKVKMIKTSSEAEQGRLVIDFYSTDDLQEVFRRLVAS